jgi:hypothetical protein
MEHVVIDLGKTSRRRATARNPKEILRQRKGETRSWELEPLSLHSQAMMR